MRYVMHTAEQLLDLIYGYYGDSETAERARLVAARKRAGASPEYEHWRALIDRIATRFPECEAANWSFYLPAGTFDGGYRGELTRPGADTLGFYVSFLAPYYVVYARREKNGVLEASLGLEPAEQRYATGIAEEIVTSYPGYVPLPPEIGSVKVPGVRLGSGAMKATIYDLLFSEYDRLAVDEEDRQQKAAFMAAYRALRRDRR